MKPVKVEQGHHYHSVNNAFGSYEIVVRTATITGVFGEVVFEQYDDSYWQVVWTATTHNIPYDWWRTQYKPSKELVDVVKLLEENHRSLLEEWL